MSKWFHQGSLCGRFKRKKNMCVGVGGGGWNSTTLSSRKDNKWKIARHKSHMAQKNSLGHRINSWMVKWKQGRALPGRARAPFDFRHFSAPLHLAVHPPAFLCLCPSIRVTNQLGGFRPRLLLQYLSTGEESIHVRRPFSPHPPAANSCCFETSLI